MTSRRGRWSVGSFHPWRLCIGWAVVIGGIYRCYRMRFAPPRGGVRFVPLDPRAAEGDGAHLRKCEIYESREHWIGMGS